MQEIMNWNIKIWKFVKENKFYLLPTILALNAQTLHVLGVWCPIAASPGRSTPSCCFFLALNARKSFVTGRFSERPGCCKSGVKRPEGASFWRSTPRRCSFLAFNAQMATLTGVERPVGASFGRSTPKTAFTGFFAPVSFFFLFYPLNPSVTLWTQAIAILPWR